MREIPFIKLFRTVKAYYIFDVNTVSIIRVDSNLYSNLEKLIMGNIKFSQIDSVALDKINKLKSQGFLEPCNVDMEIKQIGRAHV